MGRSEKRSVSTFVLQSVAQESAFQPCCKLNTHVLACVSTSSAICTQVPILAASATQRVPWGSEPEVERALFSPERRSKLALIAARWLHLSRLPGRCNALELARERDAVVEFAGHARAVHVCVLPCGHP
jgi:hypothetical protein